jgi:hypothetical protein
MKTRPMGDIERARKGWMPALGEAPRGDFSADLALREWETAGLAAKKIPAPDRDLRDGQSHEVGVFQRSARALHPDAITGFDLSKIGNLRSQRKTPPDGDQGAGPIRSRRFRIKRLGRRLP